MYYRQKLKRTTIFATVLLTLFSVLSMAIPQRAAAAGADSDLVTSVMTEVKNHQKYYWLRNCFFHYDINKVTEGELDSWDFFEGSAPAEGSEIVGAVYGAGPEATWGCGEEDNVATAFKALGVTDPREAFCKIDGARADGQSNYNYKDCHKATGVTWDNKAGDWADVQGGDFEKEAAIWAPNVVKPISDVQNYVRYYASLINQCNVSIAGGEYQEGTADAPTKYRIPVVSYASKTIQYRLGTGNPTGGSQVPIVATKSGGMPYTQGDVKAGGFIQPPTGEVITCDETVKRLRTYAQAYQTYLNGNPGQETTQIDPAATTLDKESCESLGNPLSWILCPGLALLDGGIYLLTQGIESLLNVDESKYNNDSLVQIWQVMRNIALLILVPMMLLMVIGTALEFGPFDAYTVKKALPRMVLAVMFITLSLPITQFFINVSNVVGVGIQGLVLSASDSPSSLLELYDVGEATGLTGLVVGGAIVAGGTGAITLGVIASLGLVAFVTLLIGFLVLIVRELLILVLMVVAPLAILVWIFPANDKLWKIWKTTFIALLMMFPLIMLLISSGKVFAGIIGDVQGSFTALFLKIIVLIAPFFFIPATFKYGLGVFGNIAGIINDRSRGLFDRQRKFREGSRANASARAKAGQRFAGGNKDNWRGKLNRGIAGGVNAPSAILSTGNAFRPNNWRGVTATQMGNNDISEVERNMKENPHYQSWMYNDDLNRIAARTNNAEDLRREMKLAKDENGNRIFADADIEDGVNRVESVRRTMSDRAFRTMTTRQAIAGGTAFKDGQGTDAGRVVEAIAQAAGGDAAIKQYLVANARSESMKAGRADVGGTTFSGMYNAVNEAEANLDANGDLSDEKLVDISEKMHDNVAGNQNGATISHSSMKPTVAKEMAPALNRRVTKSLQNIGDPDHPELDTNEAKTQRFMQALAGNASVYDGMAGSSPDNAKIISEQVLATKIHEDSLPPEVRELYKKQGLIDDNREITMQMAIEGARAAGSNGDPVAAAFIESRREYGSPIGRNLSPQEQAALQQQQGGQQGNPAERNNNPPG